MIPKWDTLIDPTFTYRYWLTREWSEAHRTVAFIGLNPSTASATIDDPTLRRMTRFAQRLNAGRLVVVNLFALRSTSPELLRTHRDPVGPECDQHLVQACRRADVVIAAWGAHPMARDRELSVCVMLGLALDISLHCLGQTKDGAPKHPLYLPAHAPLTVYRSRVPPGVRPA